MTENPTLFRVEGEYLIGPNGRWRIPDIKAAYIKEGGRLDFKKWAGVLAGTTLGVAGMALTPVGGFVVAGAACGYLAHRTMRVFALIDGHETELHAEVYFQMWWGEDRANRVCGDIVRLIETAQKSRNAS